LRTQYHYTGRILEKQGFSGVLVLLYAFEIFGVMVFAIFGHPERRRMLRREGLDGGIESARLASE